MVHTLIGVGTEARRSFPNFSTLVRNGAFDVDVLALRDVPEMQLVIFGGLRRYVKLGGRDHSGPQMGE